MSVQWRVVLVWWLACALWSSTWLFIRVGLQDIPPLTFAWMRLAIALAVLAPVTMRRAAWRSLEAGDLARIVAAGLLLLGVNYGLTFWGAQFIPSGLAAILQALTPVLALAFGWCAGSETVGAGKVLGLIAGVVGVATIFSAEASLSGPQAILGAGAVLAGAACVALAYVAVKTRTTPLQPVDITTIQIAAAVVPLAILALLVEGPPVPARWPLTAWSALLYLAIGGSVVAFWMNYWLLRRMDTSAMLMMGVAEVPIAIGLGAAILDERLPALTLAGASVALAGVAAVLLDARRSER
jgi:drug/metabolite transporter (DMT)-like permease